MKIAIASDLHLEFGDIDLPNEEGADVLVLSGDVMIANDLHKHKMSIDDLPKNAGAGQRAAAMYRGFLKRCSAAFPHVIYVAGNHEFYDGKWVGSIQDLRDECAVFPNVYFLEQDLKEINGVLFVGGTLWTDCNKGDPLTMHAITDLMNDFRAIRNDSRGYTKLRANHTIERHIATKQYIDLVLSDRKDQTTVVVGHHAPSHLSIHDRYKNDHLMNGAYYSDLSEFILDHPQIKLWTHGHTHHRFDYNIGDTRIVCNPRGYKDYEPSALDFELKYVEI